MNVRLGAAVLLVSGAAQWSAAAGVEAPVASKVIEVPAAFTVQTTLVGRVLADHKGRVVVMLFASQATQEASAKAASGIGKRLLSNPSVIEPADEAPDTLSVDSVSPTGRSRRPRRSARPSLPYSASA